MIEDLQYGYVMKTELLFRNQKHGEWNYRIFLRIYAIYTRIQKKNLISKYSDFCNIRKYFDIIKEVH